MAAPEPAAPKADDKKPASIEIELPAEAKLIVDGQVVPGTGASRAFTTPALLADRTYYYEMSAELPIDGAMVRQELRVVVRGGEIVKESFGELLAKVKAANTATVANK